MRLSAATQICSFLELLLRLQRRQRYFLALLRQIVGHPKSDAGRRLGAGWLLQHLQAEPAPAGALVADALATQLASADGRMRLNRKPF